jgi:nucleoid-associated protein YgaU
MALAAPPEVVWDDPEDEMPWPRPVLRLVVPPAEEPDRAAPVAPFGTGTDVSKRRRARASLRARRRRAVAGLVAAGALALLALPVTGLGGRPADVHRLASLGAGATYVVQPGDTLWSIAVRADRNGSPRALAQDLASETGSADVYPGERIVIP